MKKVSLIGLVIGTLSLCSAGFVNAATIFADTVVNEVDTTAFGSGLVTGAPDGGDRFLGPDSDPPARPGQITVSFAVSLSDGAGADLQVIDIEGAASDPGERASVFVSTDGAAFTFVGNIIGGTAEGLVDWIVRRACQLCEGDSRRWRHRFNGH